jgi:hypothetical protein
MSLVLFPVCFPKNSETLLKLDAKTIDGLRPEGKSDAICLATVWT